MSVWNISVVLMVPLVGPSGSQVLWSLEVLQSFQKYKDLGLAQKCSDPTVPRILGFQNGDSVDDPVLELTMGKCN